MESLEHLGSEEDGPKSMAQEEFEYAKKMISTNLSNFSAWHCRTKLIQRLLNEKSASNEERKKMLDDGRQSRFLAVEHGVNGYRAGTHP